MPFLMLFYDTQKTGSLIKTRLKRIKQKNVSSQNFKSTFKIAK